MGTDKNIKLHIVTDIKKYEDYYSCDPVGDLGNLRM